MASAFRQRRPLAAIITALLLLDGCDKSLPSAPAELPPASSSTSTPISFVGEENVANYQLTRGPCSHDTFNDCASSVRLFRR